MSLPRRVLALVVAALVLAGCRVDATVDVTVDDDGSGWVRVAVVLDADAAARAAPTPDAVPTDDLEAAGWTVPERETATDGSVTLRAEKRFTSPDQLAVVLAEVSTAFGEVGLERDRSFGTVTWTFRGEVDLSGGAESFGDEQLAALLGGNPLGRDVASLEQEIGSSLADASSLRFTVDMPGGSSEEWTFRLGDPATRVEAQGEVTSDRARVLAVVAVGAAGLLVLLVALRVVRARRRRRRRRSRRAQQSRARQSARSARDLPSEVLAPPVVAVEEAPKRLQLVVVNPAGVLWERASVSDQWLVDLVAMQGGSASIEQVRAVTHEAKLGRIGTPDVWRALGASGDPAELDAAYAARFTLGPAVADLVTTLARRGVGVACVSDDAVEWSALLRRRFGLDRFIRPWVSSADVGARPPAAALLEAVAGDAGIPPKNCLMIDVDPAPLDTARSLGMATVLLSTDPGAALVAAERGHDHITDLADLLARRDDGVSERSG